MPEYFSHSRFANEKYSIFRACTIYNILDYILYTILYYGGGGGGGGGSARVKNPRNSTIKIQNQTSTKHHTRHIHKTRRRAGGFNTFKATESYLSSVQFTLFQLQSSESESELSGSAVPGRFTKLIVLLQRFLLISFHFLEIL